MEYIHSIASADGLLGEGGELDGAIASHNRRIRELRLRLVALEVEYAQNPNAYRIINSPDELIEVVDIDLVRLTQDKDAGRIKSFKMTEMGPQVELYAADAALRDLAKVHGLFEKDNQQQASIGLNDLTGNKFIRRKTLGDET